MAMASTAGPANSISLEGVVHSQPPRQEQHVVLGGTPRPSAPRQSTRIVAGTQSQVSPVATIATMSVAP